jgi:hypothetical protein
MSSNGAAPGVIDVLLKKISDEGAAVGRACDMQESASKPEPIDWTNIFFVLAQNDALPLNVLVPNGFKI